MGSGELASAPWPWITAVVASLRYYLLPLMQDFVKGVTLTVRAVKRVQMARTMPGGKSAQATERAARAGPRPRSPPITVSSGPGGSRTVAG